MNSKPNMGPKRQTNKQYPHTKNPKAPIKSGQGGSDIYHASSAKDMIYYLRIDEDEDGPTKNSLAAVMTHPVMTRFMTRLTDEASPRTHNNISALMPLILDLIASPPDIVTETVGTSIDDYIAKRGSQVDGESDEWTTIGIMHHTLRTLDDDLDRYVQVSSQDQFDTEAEDLLGALKCSSPEATQLWKDCKEWKNLKQWPAGLRSHELAKQGEIEAERYNRLWQIYWFMRANSNPGRGKQLLVSKYKPTEYNAKDSTLPWKSSNICRQPTMLTQEQASKAGKPLICEYEIRNPNFQAHMGKMQSRARSVGIEHEPLAAQGLIPDPRTFPDPALWRNHLRSSTFQCLHHRLGLSFIYCTLFDNAGNELNARWKLLYDAGTQPGHDLVKPNKEAICEMLEHEDAVKATFLVTFRHDLEEEKMEEPPIRGDIEVGADGSLIYGVRETEAEEELQPEDDTDDVGFWSTRRTAEQGLKLHESDLSSTGPGPAGSQAPEADILPATSGPAPRSNPILPESGSTGADVLPATSQSAPPSNPALPGSQSTGAGVVQSKSNAPTPGYKSPTIENGTDLEFSNNAHPSTPMLIAEDPDGPIQPMSSPTLDLSQDGENIVDDGAILETEDTIQSKLRQMVQAERECVEREEALPDGLMDDYLDLRRQLTEYPTKVKVKAWPAMSSREQVSLKNQADLKYSRTNPAVKISLIV